MPYCVWTVDVDAVWHTQCGVSFEFTDDGLVENRFYFCHHCGGRIIDATPKADDDA